MPFASPWQLPPPALLPGTAHCRQAIGRPSEVYIPVRLAGLILTGMTLHGVEAATVDCVHFLQVHSPGRFRAEVPKFMWEISALLGHTIK